MVTRARGRLPAKGKPGIIALADGGTAEALGDPIRGDCRLDPFIGVGSTAVAALMHGRKALGAEIIPEYVAIARDRITLAEAGKLRIRPMDRPVYDPTSPRPSQPPRVVRLGAVPQLQLLEVPENHGDDGTG